MTPDEIKIPVINISIHDVSGDISNPDLNSVIKSTLFDEFIADADEIEKYTNVAYLRMGVAGGTLFPARARCYRVESLGNEVVNGGEGCSFRLKLIDQFELGSFDVEYVYDAEFDAEIPKYIIINNINKKGS